MVKIDFEVENLCWFCSHFLCGACGCPYNNLVICKDSSDCLSVNIKKVMAFLIKNLTLL